MKIVVAMDSFKGSLSAVDACEAVARGFSGAIPKAEIVVCPIADGGEGTASSILRVRDGNWISTSVTGPLEEIQLTAGYAWLPDDGPGAVVEMAQASGLSRVGNRKPRPLLATTFGTGQLLRSAIGRGARRIWLGVGDSATVDGGVGAAMALGWRFLDDQGKTIGLGGAELTRINTLVPPAEEEMPTIEVLCDVDNPLCGDRGAARGFGPQKGAAPDDVAVLEDALAHLAAVVDRDLGVDLTDLKGAGAAGGLAGGAVAFMNASLLSGVETIFEILDFREYLKDAEWVITGEGRLDRQSLAGKSVSEVTRVALRQGVKVAVLAGSVDLEPEAQRGAGIDIAKSILEEGKTIEQAMVDARPLLEQAAARLAGDLEVFPGSTSV